mmetsp:Transcript_43118/g.136235  ORF Transcript_43118/g.136235 Transcript_43118/m.136235 type:complete len:90 (-) Transcript_43118:118-387(-)
MAEAEAGGNEDQAPAKVLNINVGVMGHVDSGKTSLVRALSKTLSTAALDKHPQSQERGITLACDRLWLWQKRKQGATRIKPQPKSSTLM